jgi:hypothetical protein
VPDDGRELALPAWASDDAADGDATDDAPPEWPRGDVRREHRELPPAGEAREQHTGDARADAPPSVRPQHEELGQLAGGHPPGGREVSDEGEAGRPAAHTHDEVMAIVTPPESPVPARRSVRAIGLDAPALTDEIIEVELDEPPDDGDVTWSQWPNRDARHAR